MASLKSSVSEAEIIYQEVVRIDRTSDRADKAVVEMAKIHYALGDYGQTLNMLRESSACRSNARGVLFPGAGGHHAGPLRRRAGTFGRGFVAAAIDHGLTFRWLRLI